MTLGLTKEEQLERLTAKKARLTERQKRLRAQLSRAARKADTRRKILLGAWLMDRAGGDIERLGVQLSNWLIRDQDRALFGLAPLAVQPQREAAQPLAQAEAVAAQITDVGTR